MRKILFAFFLTCATAHLSAENENFMNGLALLDQQKYEEAAIAFTAALEESPADPFFWERRGYAFYCAKHHYEAINNYTMAIILVPKNPFYYVQRALAYAETANHNAMVNDLVTAARLGDPNAQEFLDKHEVPWRI